MPTMIEQAKSYTPKACREMAIALAKELEKDKGAVFELEHRAIMAPPPKTFSGIRTHIQSGKRSRKLTRDLTGGW